MESKIVERIFSKMSCTQRVHTTDSCWSWVVCMSATISTMLMFGFALSFGVYQPYLMEYFGENKERTSWTGSIMIGLILFSGPFAVFLTDRFGHRTVNMACGFICSVSVMASSFVNHLVLLYFSFSVLYGLAGGIILNIGYTIIKQYFKRYWSVAVGIVSSGSVIGMLILTQCSEFLIEALGWRDSFRIMSGIIFFITIASATYHPMSIQKEEVNLDSERVKYDDQISPEQMKDKQTSPNQKMDLQEQNNSVKTQYYKPVTDEKEQEKEGEEETNDDSKKVCQETLGKSNAEHVFIEEGKGCDNDVNQGNENRSNQEVHVQEKHRKMTFKDVFSLFKNIYFVFGLISTTLVYFGIYSPHIHLMQFSLDLGMTHLKSAQLYIYFTIVNIISRLVSGHLASKVKLSPLALLQLAEFFCGTAVILLSFAKTYGHLVGFCIAYGVGNGCFITFQVLFAMSVVEPIKSGLSLGVAYLIGSIAVISGPPFAGYIADSTGSYVMSFYVVGGIMTFASFLPCIIHIKKLLSK